MPSPPYSVRRARCCSRSPTPGSSSTSESFAGFLLYIGASDILPEAHANHPSRLTLVMTISGTALMWILLQAIGT